MQIFGATNIQNTSGVQSGNVQKVQQADNSMNADAPQSTSSPAIDTVDQLDISSEAKMLSQLKVAGEIRADRVSDIRAQIETGQYETQEKIDLAVSRLLDELV